MLPMRDATNRRFWLAALLVLAMVTVAMGPAPVVACGVPGLSAAPVAACGMPATDAACCCGDATSNAEGQEGALAPPSPCDCVAPAPGPVSAAVTPTTGPGVDRVAIASLPDKAGVAPEAEPPVHPPSDIGPLRAVTGLTSPFRGPPACS